MQDQIEKLRGSVIHHGPLNKRIYVMKYHHEDPVDFLEALLKLARKEQYEKIIMKIPESQQVFFLANGFTKEAKIPGFFSGKESAVFLGRYLSEERKQQKNIAQLRDIIQQVSQQRRLEQPVMNANWECRILGKQDIPELQKIYRAVFPSYPFPIDQADYLLETMQSHVVYFGIFDGQQLMAAASCEMDMDRFNVEMTDFATYPAFRGKGLASLLLASMETVMQKRNLCTAYTIARAVSYGMNRVFANGNYQFGGMLLNNTNIAGQIEAMNIWHKQLN